MTKNTNPTTTTRQIAGHDITLTTGCWYIATRPMACRGRSAYPITIRDDAFASVLTINDLTYDAANDFLAAFNNGEISFDGRTW